MILILIIIVGLVILFFKISSQKQIEKIKKDMGNKNETFQLKSTAFKEGDTIPEKYTCDGEDVNPLLEIKNSPDGTESFALIVDDPDAPGGVWDHWIMWNIRANTQYIPEDSVPQNVSQGMNSFNKQKYGGPCPPFESDAHHYRFTIYALNIKLDIPEESGGVELKSAIKEHVLGEAMLTGVYKRRM